MKKFWLVLLSLGLVMAFSVSAFAVDVKVSGEYYAAGMYLNKTKLQSGEQRGDVYSPSTAFYFQRLRVGTDFIVSPCLKLVTRFDAMERIWGGQRSGYGGKDDDDDDYDYMSAGTRAENENIAFDLVYIDYTSPVGIFRVGYQKDQTWGTIFGNNGEATPLGQIGYERSFGPVTVVAAISKIEDRSYSAVEDDQDKTDKDADSYRLGAFYNFSNDKVKGDAGLLFTYLRDATHKYDGRWSRKSQIYTLNPYFKTMIGPVTLQGELAYSFGDYKDRDNEDPPPTASDVKVDSLSAFLDAGAKFGMFTVGGSIAYLQGDDNPYDDVQHNYNTGGLDWNSCLIMFNNDVINYWVGGLEGKGHSQIGGPMSNAWFFQGRVGVKPTPQFDVNLSVSYAMTDKKPLDPNNDRPFANGTYGTEVDLTGTYKITNNLSYMLGAGYLFTGNYFKGADRHQMTVQDDFMLINKLTLTF